MEKNSTSSRDQKYSNLRVIYIRFKLRKHGATNRANTKFINYSGFNFFSIIRDVNIKSGQRHVRRGTVNLKFTMHCNESECRFFVVLNFYSIKQTAALIRISFERRKFP